MSKLLRLLALALLLALIPALLALRRDLPTDRQALIGEKYGGWSGVLSLWVCEGWPSGCGSVSPWLNRCVTLFEKAHPGVYIQVETVEADTLREWDDGTMAAPDLLLFPPGLLETPKGLAPLAGDTALRGDLSRLGDWAGIRYALPVAMGGYARLWAPEADGGPAVPAEEPFRLWAAAQAVMRAPTAETEVAPQPASPDVDLGLPAASTWRSAWQRFAAGEADSLLASQREILRLEALREQGKGPNWSLDAASPFTDQLLFIAVPRGDDSSREALTEAFAASLLSEECQGELHRAGLFPTADCDAGYGPAEVLGALEALLRDMELLAPGAFGSAWREAVTEVLQNKQGDDPNDLITELRTILG